MHQVHKIQIIEIINTKENETINVYDKIMNYFDKSSGKENINENNQLRDIHKKDSGSQSQHETYMWLNGLQFAKTLSSSNSLEYLLYFS